MTTTTLTLAAFLEARLAEDEAEALAVERDVTAEFGHAMSVLSSALAAAGSGYMEYPVLTIDPTRVLAEVAAKRAVLAIHENWTAPRGRTPNMPADAPSSTYSLCGCCSADLGVGEVSYPCDTLRHLTSIYSDHENYDPSWAVS